MTTHLQGPYGNTWSWDSLGDDSKYQLRLELKTSDTVVREIPVALAIALKLSP